MTVWRHHIRTPVRSRALVRPCQRQRPRARPHRHLRPRTRPPPHLRPASIRARRRPSRDAAHPRRARNTSCCSCSRSRAHPCPRHATGTIASALATHAASPSPAFPRPRLSSPARPLSWRSSAPSATPPRADMPASGCSAPSCPRHGHAPAHPSAADCLSTLRSAPVPVRFRLAGTDRDCREIRSYTPTCSPACASGRIPSCAPHSTTEPPSARYIRFDQPQSVRRGPPQVRHACCASATQVAPASAPLAPETDTTELHFVRTVCAIRASGRVCHGLNSAARSTVTRRSGACTVIVVWLAHPAPAARIRTRP